MSPGPRTSLSVGHFGCLTPSDGEFIAMHPLEARIHRFSSASVSEGSLSKSARLNRGPRKLARLHLTNNRAEQCADTIGSPQTRCSRQSCKGRQVGRTTAKRKGEAVQAHPSDEVISRCCDEGGVAQRRRDAVDGALMVCGVRMVLGVKPRDRPDGLLYTDGKDR
jgi:hypothetical protein